MKKKILVIFGGMSSEHRISCVSAANVIEHLNEDTYSVSKLGIDREGKWYLYKGKVQNIRDDQWEEDMEQLSEVSNVLEELKKYDIVFPVLHGKYGEDGTIQGLLELAKVKYVGSKVLASAIGNDKAVSKKLVSLKDIPIVPYIELDKEQFNRALDSDEGMETLAEQVENDFSYPAIVKPNREGSSYGIVMVDTKEMLKDAMEFAFKYDSKILIEQYLDQKHEVECAVLERKGKGLEKEIFVSTPGEVICANDFYDYDAKYVEEGTVIKIPANLEETLCEKIRGYAKEIFRTLNLRGLARIDFFVTDEEIYFNEINTIPGFTDISMFPKLFEHDGIAYEELLQIIIENG